MGAPAPVVSASAYIAFFVIRHSTDSKFHSFPFTRSLANNLFGPLPVHSRRCSLKRENLLSASFGCLPWLPSRRYSYPPPRLPTIFLISQALFQFRPNLPECCQFSSAVVVHNITFMVLKGDLDIHEISI